MRDGSKYPPRRCPPGRAIHTADLRRRERAQIKNGAVDLPRVVDGRTSLAKRFRDIVAQLTADQGGDLSEARVQLVRRFAGASVLAEQTEAQIICGQLVDLSEYAQLISSSVRVAQRIGIDRVPKIITPSLSDYLDQKADLDVQVGDEDLEPGGPI